MSSPLAGAAPTGLPPPRRLNKMPLALGLAVAVIIAVALGWAVYQRGQKAQRAAAEEETIRPQNMQSAVDNLLKGYEGMGVIPDKPVIPDPPEPIPAYIEPKATPTPVPQPLPLPKVETAPVKPERSPEEQARQQRLLAAEQQAWQMLGQALDASSSVNVSGLAPVATGTVATQHQPTPSPESSEQKDLLATGQGLLRVLRERGTNASEQVATAKAGATQALTQGFGWKAATPQPVTGLRPDQDQVDMRALAGANRGSVLRLGTLIPAVMLSGINSDLPGDVLAQVAEDVRDTLTGQHVLIPQGSKLVGEYSSDIAEGQERVRVVWTRVNFPNGTGLTLDRMAGVDVAGYAGFSDKVNRHTVDKFKESTLLSVISGLGQLSQAGKGEAAQQMAASLGQGWAAVGQEVVKRKLERPATLEIRPGYRFNVFLKKDWVLKPYHKTTE